MIKILIIAKMTSICRKIHNQVGKSITEDFPDRPAIYLILEKNKPLYLGQTNNLHRRLKEHMRGEQAIDKKLQQLNPSNIKVKYEEREDAKQNEQNFIKCMENIIGKPLPYNIIKGIGQQ
ncbi:hypothetical protein AC249_AIPGENE3296 [Exaiptasia diaphana]|nr:hypothetical protein AC249_AIPGENE3296 [Exaiptasia diaphana]